VSGTAADDKFRGPHTLFFGLLYITTVYGVTLAKFWQKFRLNLENTGCYAG